jgi:hypothetical protein
MNFKAKVRHSEACKDKNFKTWVAAVCLLNEVHTVEKKCQCELIKETLQQCQASDVTAQLGLEVGNVTGYPGVFQSNPCPYPCPQAQVFVGHVEGLQKPTGTPTHTGLGLQK